MSYNRVIPRDLFNEGNLLKMYGRLYILSETTPGLRVFETLEWCEPFDIQQDENGDLYLANVHVEAAGHELDVRRPLNSRKPWSLRVDAIDGDSSIDPFNVFTDTGDLSPEMLALLRGDERATDAPL